MDIDVAHSDHENELTALERRLAAWRPAGGGLDRDGMLFRAGAAAARADDRTSSWRLATAASVLLTATLGGLLAHERSQRLALESQALARSDRHDPPPPTANSVHLATIETPVPDSYLALTARFANGGRDLSLLDREFDSQPRRPPATSSRSSPSLEPLRPRELERILDL